MRTKRILFRNLDTHGWQNIGMAGLFSFYLITWVWTYLRQGLFTDTMGVDYLIMWSSGYTANHYGYLAVYDFVKLSSIQHQIALLNGIQPSVFPAPIPLILLPIFIIPFQWLAVFDLHSGFFLYSLINLFIFIIYIRHFLIQHKTDNLPRLLLISIFTYYFFFNIFCGNVNVFLMIFMGEFLRSMNNKNYLPSGLWMCGLILKLQILVLLIPLLFFQKKWKTLLTFGIGVSVIVFLSALILGIKNIPGLFLLWIKGNPNPGWDSPRVMMNLRMVGDLLSHFTYPILAWGLVLITTFVILFIVFKIWKTFKDNFLQNTYFVYFATIIATFIITWHSNTHMELVILPLLLLFYGQKILPEKILSLHLFCVPIVILLFSVVFGALDLVKYNAQLSLIGFTILVCNLITLVWASNYSNRMEFSR